MLLTPILLLIPTLYCPVQWEATTTGNLIYVTIVFMFPGHNNCGLYLSQLYTIYYTFCMLTSNLGFQPLSPGSSGIFEFQICILPLFLVPFFKFINLHLFMFTKCTYFNPKNSGHFYKCNIYSFSYKKNQRSWLFFWISFKPSGFTGVDILQNSIVRFSILNLNFPQWHWL